MFYLKHASRVLLLVLVAAVSGGHAQHPASPALTLQQIDSPARAGSGQPNLYVSADGLLYLSWIEVVEGKGHAVRFAARKGGIWSEPRTIIESADLLVNWADFPSLVALPGGELVAHWPVKGDPGTHASSIRISRSTDGGKTWSKPVIPHSDKSMVEHGFVSMVALPDGRVAALWLDGRNKKPDPHGGHASTGDTNLRYTVVGAGGQASEDMLIDPRVCDCCPTSAALTSEGPVAVYRDRSEKELRDISIVRLVKGRWTDPRPVSTDGWEIHGCPVNGPSVAADGRRVAVAWFTAPKEKSRVKIAFSNDAGATFGGPIQVDDATPAGRVDISMLPDGSALVSWLERTERGGEIKVRRVKADGSRSAPVTVAESNALRVTGVPQIVRAGNEVFFAWTEPGTPSSVRVAVAKIAGR
ncbi:MAG TPA: sialidase family protein [Blastocatellia bacterium]|nr:sialidase family protein [Blastocatellia bacterium]